MSETIETKSTSGRDRTRMAIGAAALIVALAAGAGWYHFKDRVSTDDAQVDGHLVPVSCKVGGSVERIAVEDNQAVKAGDKEAATAARADIKETTAQIRQDRADRRDDRREVRQDVREKVNQGK